MSITAPPTATPVAGHAEAAAPPEPRSRRPRPRTVVAIVVVTAVAATAAWWFLLRDDGTATATTTTEPQVVEVTTGTFGEVVSAEGTVAAAQSEDLSFGSAGTVTSVNVAAGDTVTAGQVLATIDSAELEAALADAEADLADAEATLDDAEDGGASDEQIEAYEAAVTTARDAVDEATENLGGASLVATFDGLVTSVDLTLGEQLGSSGVNGTSSTGSSTGSGQSSTRLGSDAVGGLPNMGGSDQSSTDSSGSEPQIQVVSQGRFVVEVGVDSADIDQVEVGQQVDLSISADSSGDAGQFPGFPGGGAFPGGGFPAGGGVPGGGGQSQDAGGEAAASSSATGTVTEVSRVADASSGVATYAVTISFTDDTGDVWAGSTATAEINVSARKDVVQVSAAAVTTEDGTSTVTVALDGTVDGDTEQREVRTGERSGAMIEVVSGLTPGEKVIVEGGTTRGFPGGGQLPDGFEPPTGGGFPGGGQLPEGFQPPGGGAASESAGDS